MKPTLHQLHIFKMVVDFGGYTKAALKLHLSQPAVSIQVKQLEETVGLSLIEFISTKLYLTEAGETLYECASVIQNQLDNAQEGIDQLQGIHRGRLKISVATTASYFVISMLADFAKTYPKIAVSLDVTNRSSLLDQLSNNERDIVIMGEPPENQALQATAFKDNPLVLVASPQHKLAKQKKLILTDFAEQTFVLRECGSGTRAAAERAFETANLNIKSTLEMTSNEAIKQAVQANMGLGIVSRYTVIMEIETHRLLELSVKNFPIMRKWYIVKLAKKKLSPVAQLFEKFVLEY